MITIADIDPVLVAEMGDADAIFVTPKGRRITLDRQGKPIPTPLPNVVRFEWDPCGARGVLDSIYVEIPLFDLFRVVSFHMPRRVTRKAVFVLELTVNI